jgi:hypothetical protein
MKAMPTHRLRQNPAGNNPASSESGEAAASGTRPSRLWLWFIAAFCVQVAAWSAWFIIASQHRVQEVPLATNPVQSE